MGVADVAPSFAGIGGAGSGRQLCAVIAFSLCNAAVTKLVVDICFVP